MNKRLYARKIAEIVGAKNVKTDEPMKLHTSFKIGGPADFLVTPENDESLSELLKFCKQEDIPVTVIGNGSNLLVKDGGIRGVVIKICENYSECIVENEIIKAESGILLSRVSGIAFNNGLTGLEFASGIPGTLGGAIVMNAGAYGGQMQDVVVMTQYMDMDGEIHALKGDQHGFGYRTSVLQKIRCVVLRCEMSLKKGEKESIGFCMKELSQRRKKSQPLEFPSAGSIFKRPEGHFAGPLIEKSNLKGFRIGGAQVSEKHCGFIINTGNATAKDVVSLISHVQEQVFKNFGVKLETEVKIIGED